MPINDFGTAKFHQSPSSNLMTDNRRSNEYGLVSATSTGSVI